MYFEGIFGWNEANFAEIAKVTSKNLTKLQPKKSKKEPNDKFQPCSHFNVARYKMLYGKTYRKDYS